MYLIVRTSDLVPSLAQARARVRPPPFIARLSALPPRLAPIAAHDRPIGDREDAACCGCFPEGEIGQVVRRAPAPAPMNAAAPPPFAPPPFGEDDLLGALEEPRLERRVEALEGHIKALERGTALRVEALETHVNVLDGALERRDAAEREEREREEVLERAEDRVFGALVDLFSATWERWREERRRVRRRR